MADSDERVQPRVQRLDGMQMRHRQIDGGEFAGAQLLARFGDGQIGQHYSTTFGTAKNCPARSGALARIFSG